MNFNFDLLSHANPPSLEPWEFQIFENTRAVVQSACLLTRLVPNEEFTDEIALFCAGVDWQMVKKIYKPDSSTKVLMRGTKNSFDQTYGAKSMFHTIDDKYVFERYKGFVTFATRWPNSSMVDKLHSFDGDLNSHFGCARTAALFMVGATRPMTLTSHSVYSLCRRFESKFFKTNERGRKGWKDIDNLPNPLRNYPELTSSDRLGVLPAVLVAPLHQPAGAPAITIQSDQRNNITTMVDEGVRLSTMPISPISAVTPAGVDTNFSFGDSFARSRTSVESRTTTSVEMSVESNNQHLVPGNDVPSTSSVAPSLLSANSRRTTTQRHLNDQENSIRDQERKVAFGTALQMVKAWKENKLQYFANVIDIVQAVNQMHGCGEGKEDLVTTSEIITAVKKGLTKPPRKGHERLPDGAFEHLCDLFFSCTSIAQYNCEQPLLKPYLILLLDRIIKPYFESEGRVAMNPTYLFDRIRKFNSFRQDVNTSDPRQMLRVMWFTAERMNKHYERTEEFLVEKAFARLASSEELDINPNERIKWKPGQPARGINGDETYFGLDDSSQSQGGRKAVGMVNSTIKQAGFAAQHSSVRLTLFMAATYADEPLPPILILPASGDQKRIGCELISRCHQVEGSFGHIIPKRFNPMVAASPKGSMTSEILKSYCLYLTQLYPDVADEPGKRLFIKLDNAVGRNNTGMNFVARQYGIYIYPACPNTSEGSQEMDQSFGKFKSLTEINRVKIAELRANQGEAGATILDVPYIIFGGTYPLSNGSSVILRNCFSEAFAPRNLKSSREKCGYCPATREALRHEKCSREAGVDFEEGQYDVVSSDNTDLVNNMNLYYNDQLRRGADGTDAYTSLLKTLEEMNRYSCEKLQEMGFAKAKLAKKLLKESQKEALPEAQRDRASRTHHPAGSRGRQDQLEAARFPGEIFNITSGGAANNCDDMLIVLARKKLKSKAKNLEKLKKTSEDRRAIVERAQAYVAAGGPKLKPQFVDCIMWKKGQVVRPKGKVMELKAI